MIVYGGIKQIQLQELVMVESAGMNLKMEYVMVVLEKPMLIFLN